jgi:hypothetical protein
MPGSGSYKSGMIKILLPKEFSTELLMIMKTKEFDFTGGENTC